MKRPDANPAVATPYIDPQVAATNPAAAAYMKSLKQRQSPLHAAEPRGGGPVPPIPLLNAPHQEGMTMADQARSARMAIDENAGQQGTIFSPEAAAAAAGANQQGVLQNDILPEAARADPSFREGHGSLYAVNQPHLAKKYGVIRNGKHIPPQKIETGRNGLSGNTVEGLEAVAKFNEQRKSAEIGDTAAEQAAKQGIAGEAAKLANPSGRGDAEPVSDEQRKEAERALKNMDEFDFNTFREVMMKDLLNNDEQRKIVEERVDTLDLSSLIMNGYVQQRVPIVPSTYEPTFQSFTGEEELALKRLLMDERKGIEAPDRYLLDKFQLMTVALGISQINNTKLPDHRDKDGNFNDDLFWKKFNRILKLPFHMLASMGVHYYWFDIRVRKLFVAERIKNG